VLKLDSDGNELWNKSYSWSTGADRARGVAIDSSKNIIVVGEYYNSTYNNDWKILELDSSGNTLWSNNYNFSNDWDVPYGVAIDSKGNSITVGYAYDATTHEDWKILKLNGSGTQLFNETIKFSSYEDAARSVATDAADNIYIAGWWTVGSGEDARQDWKIVKMDPYGNYTTDFSINSTRITNTSKGILVWKATAGRVVNTTMNNSANCGMSLEQASQTNTITNSTFTNNYYGVCIDTSSTGNTFYYNNFTSSTSYHALAQIEGNHFNTTNGSTCGAKCARGNYWDDILSLEIYDTNGDGFGDAGTQYPYNSSFSSKVTANVTDYGPITSKTCYDNDGDGSYNTSSSPLCAAYFDCDDNNVTLLVPRDNLNITSSVVLCSGTYYINDSGTQGVLLLTDANSSVRCNQTVIIGNTSGAGASVLAAAGITSCDLRNYSKGISVNESVRYWSNEYNWQPSLSDAARDVSVDFNDNVYVVGTWVNVSPSNHNDWGIMKIDHLGSQSWNKSYSWSSQPDGALGVSVDPSGNVVTVGYWSSALHDWRIVKLDSDGVELWNKSIAWGNGNDDAEAVDTDASNNMTVVGMWENSMPPTNDYDWRILRLNSTGGELWNKSINWSTAGDYAKDVTIDSNNNSIVVGYDNATGDYDWRVLKLDSSGNELWNKSFGWTADGDYAYGVTADPSDNIIVVGYWTNSSPSSHYDWRVLKLDSDGNEVWNKSFSWSTGDDRAMDVAIDSSGNIIVFGEDYLPTFHWRILKLDGNGNEFWNKRVSISESQDFAYGIVLDSDDSIILAGQASEASDGTWAVVKLTSEGEMSDEVSINSTFVRNSGTGILLSNSTPGSIFNSTINSSSGCGLSINKTDSYVVRNTSFSNNYYGVCIDANSTNNTFYYNNFTSSTSYHAKADIAGNHFNTTVVGKAHGNYWDDILSLEIYDTDADGFGDSGTQYPYNSTYSSKVTANVTDWGPITSKTPVMTTEVDPLNAWVLNNTIKFECNASSGTALVNMTLWHDYSGTWTSNGTVSASGTYAEAEFNRSGMTQERLVTWGCQACNTGGGCNFSNNRTLTIDITKPTIEYELPTSPNNTRNSTYYNWVYVNATVFDVHNNSAFLDWNRSLVGWWRFENNTNDSSTYGNNGTCSGTSCPETWTGPRGKAYRFDGTNDYVLAANTASLEQNATWTISAWIRPGKTGSGTLQDFVAKYDWVVGQGGYLFRQDTTDRFVALTTDGQTADTCGVTSTILTKGNWYFVAATFDTNTNTLTCYVNGMAEATNTGATKNPTAGTLGLYLGAGSGASFPYNGSVDDVMIWGRVLSAQEINATYAGQLYQLERNFTGLAAGG
ncbi:right-handed parallel beta-helix repeat-containing protein, partial [archaeon]|nr:right-handed parallel beta-helix repeat-containing protein [archaeon]